MKSHKKPTMLGVQTIVKRENYINNIRNLFQIHPIVALLGPRQCGKTTLAKIYCENFKETVHYFDLEDPSSIEALQNPKTTLYNLEGLIVIDEIQRAPDLFQVLRVIVDERKSSQQYLILGSASPDLIRQSSESLAGRIAYEEIKPFSLEEVGDRTKLFFRGGFPNSYFAKNDNLSLLWLENYIRTFLERDIPALGITIPPLILRRFWMMITHYHGNIFNASEIGSSLSVSDKTIKNYLDILTGTFMIRQLMPWHENISKRQIKRPKIYIRDSGVFHKLLDIQSNDSLIMHPKIGASWEGFALEQIISILGLRPEECYFGGVTSQCELDLLVFYKGKKIGFEFKYSDAPSLTKSMTQSMKLLNLDALYVIYPGEKSYPLTDKIEVIAIKDWRKIC